MKILILGDSMCEFSDEGTWPWFLKNKTNFEVDCKGVGGASNYVMFENFQKHFDKKYNYIIVILTNHLRIPKTIEGKDWLCNWLPDHPSWNKSTIELPKGYAKAVIGYIKFFLNENFLSWVTEKIIDDIINTVSLNQKIIWIKGVYSEDKIFEKIKGIKIEGRLMYYSDKERTEWCNLTWDNFVKKYERDRRKNHFTAANQEAFAEFLKNILIKDVNNTLSAEDLKLEKVNWVKDKEILVPQLNSKP